MARTSGGVDCARSEAADGVVAVNSVNNID
jgi:hypothetical protein